LVLAVVLLAFPALFTVFPEATNWNLVLRCALFAIWVAVAIWVARTAVQRDNLLDRLIGATQRRQDRRRRIAADLIIQQLCRPGAKSIPHEFEFTVYSAPDDAGRLSPVFPRVDDENDLRIFEVGHGATGTAWANLTTVVVRGEAVSSDKYLLSEAQQEFHRGYKTVVAVPILSDDDRPLGVLTAISKTESRHFDDGRGGQDALRSIADALGVVLERILPT
jgi:GAF domain-containing protein